MVEILLCTTLLEMTFTNTVDFISPSNQYNYFKDNTNTETYTTTVNSKIDGFLESITLKRPVEHIRKFDYCVIKSVEKSKAKYYYYFITEVKQVTKADTLISLKCDVFQTYMFDYVIMPSFVERCHVNRWTKEGTPTDNNLDEGLEYGAMVVGSINRLKTIQNNYVICSTSPLGLVPDEGSNSGGGTGDSGSSGGSSGGSSEGSSGSPSTGKVSAQFVRFIKGYEGFASKKYYDSGGVLTVGYGTTQSDSVGWTALTKNGSCTEKEATLVLFDRLNNDYAKQVYNRMKSDGIDMDKLPSNKFDAFVDLCYNGGLGAVINSPMYKSFVKGLSDAAIVEGWESWYVRDEAGNHLQGLVYRRQAEKNIFLKNVYEKRAIQNLSGGGIVQGDGYMP